MFSLEYPFRISEIAGRWETPKYSQGEDLRRNKEAEDIKYLDQYRYAIIDGYVKYKDSLADLANEYSTNELRITKYRIAQFLRKQGVEIRDSKLKKGENKCKK